MDRCRHEARLEDCLSHKLKGGTVWGDECLFQIADARNVSRIDEVVIGAVIGKEIGIFGLRGQPPGMFAEAHGAGSLPEIPSARGSLFAGMPGGGVSGLETVYEDQGTGRHDSDPVVLHLTVDEIVETLQDWDR